jgi:hypothetical protein
MRRPARPAAPFRWGYDGRRKVPLNLEMQVGDQAE